MAPLALRARFPLGYFLGHNSDGSPATLPSVARLHASLVHAAHTGVTAVPDDGGLTASAESLTALRWFEEHPPSSISIPPYTPLNRRGGLAYRDEGVFTKGRDKSLKRVSDGTAVDGFMGWTWEESCPDEVREQIDRLCADVSCLGEADSPVVLEVARVEPTHDLDLGAGALDKGNLHVDAPASGRVDALREAHAATHPRKRPSEAADRANTSARPGSAQPPTQGVRTLSYVPRVVPLPDLPWQQAILLPCVALKDDRGRDRTSGSLVRPGGRIRACVALHRAIISRIGDGAPPVVTGIYARGAERPSNRIALQYLEPDLPTPHLPHGRGAFAVLIPAGIDATDLAVLGKALAGMRQLQTAVGTIILAEPVVAPTDEFWHAPSPGMRRWWAPVPAMLPETRGVRDGRPWGFSESALLSLGFLLRDRLGVMPSGPARQRAIVERVGGWGVTVVGARRIPDSHTERYVHALPEGHVAHPYRAFLRTDAVLPDTALWALGQTRHLGGGLMVPVDMPTGAEEVLGQ